MRGRELYGSISAMNAPRFFHHLVGDAPVPAIGVADEAVLDAPTWLACAVEPHLDWSRNEDREVQTS